MKLILFDCLTYEKKLSPTFRLSGDRFSKVVSNAEITPDHRWGSQSDLKEFKATLPDKIAFLDNLG